MGGVEGMARRKLTVGDVRRANLPERYWETSLRAIPDSMDYKQKVERYLRNLPDMLNNGIGLYLWSVENGTGKTSISSLIVKEALRYGKTVFFEESSRLKTMLINKEQFEEGLSIEQRIEMVDLLVLDDIGKEYRTASGYAENVIETLVRARVQKVRTTVMTGNVHPRDLQKVYSEDFAALLKESMIPVHVTGYDFREERAKLLAKLL
jgi:DNA replication protein DnaC